MVQENSVKSLVKATQLLKFISQNEHPPKLSSLARISGLNITTAHRLLKTLIKLGIVVLEEPSKTYKLGPTLIPLGFSALQEFNLHKEALPVMKALRDETGETVNLVVLDGEDVLIIERFRSPSLFSLNLSVGSKLPIHCTSLGRALLAFLNPKHSEEIINSIYPNRLLKN